MLVFIVDAFNLLHKIPALRESGTPRRDLIRYIAAHELTGSPANKTILVFDGYRPENEDTSTSYEVLFSCGQTADDLIQKKVESYSIKKNLRIVSDDRQVRDRARSSGAAPVYTHEFLKIKKLKKTTLSKTLPKNETHTKDISFSLQTEITEELRKKWLGA